MVEEPRLDAFRAAPDGVKAMFQLENVVSKQIDSKLLHLVKLRASQINGCSYCIDMHTHEALQAGEEPRRLLLLDAWEESHDFTEQERAALAWTDALTRISETHAPKELFEELGRHFSEEEISYLTLAIATINSWNRLAIAFRSRYQPPAQANS